MEWLSPTQLTTFGDPDTGCARKWAFKYICRIPAPQHPSAALGQDVQDEQVDPYLRDGRWFNFTKPSGEIAVALVPLLPAPKTVEIRQKFWWPMSPNHGYVGELDVLAPDSRVVPGLAEWQVKHGLPSAPLVGDIKTTSNLDYALTEATLPKDTQALVYAANRVIQHGAREVDLVWWYARTRKPHRVQRTHVRLGQDQVAREFDRIDALGRVVARLKVLAPDPEKMPVNVRACSAFGGCAYRGICDASNDPARVHAGIHEAYKNMSNNPEDFLSTYLKNGAGSAPVAPPPQPPATLQPGSKPWLVQEAVNEGHLSPAVVAREGVEGAFVRLQHLAPQGWFAAKQAQVVPPAPSPVASQPVAGLVTSQPATTAQFLDQLRAPVAAINPPESALPPAPPVGAAAPTISQAEKAPRGPGRPKKDPAKSEGETACGGPEDVGALAKMMREHGVKRIAFNGSQITEMELA